MKGPIQSYQQLSDEWEALEGKNLRTQLNKLRSKLSNYRFEYFGPVISRADLLKPEQFGDDAQIVRQLMEDIQELLDYINSNEPILE